MYKILNGLTMLLDVQSLYIKAKADKIILKHY